MVIVDKFKNVVIEIATPHQTGTGFYLGHYGLIITNEHVIRDSASVIVQGNYIERTEAKVVFIDENLDLAFLRIGFEPQYEKVDLGVFNEVKLGDSVFAVGHPFGLKFSTTKGIVSNLEYQFGGIDYIQHDAALNPGNSGGPLLSKSGEVIGINTFILRMGENVGLSLPIHHILDDLNLFLNSGFQQAIKCTTCENIIEDKPDQKKFCQNCGSMQRFISASEEYEPMGVSKKIEEILEELGYNVRLSRRGAHRWAIRQGSAKLDISYQEKTGFIIADAYLANLPGKNIAPIYQYLLKQNYYNQGMNFSVKGKNILLSLLIYDQYLHKESTTRLMGKLLSNADNYDNILVEQFGASWIKD